MSLNVQSVTRYKKPENEQVSISNSEISEIFKDFVDSNEAINPELYNIEKEIESCIFYDQDEIDTTNESSYNKTIGKIDFELENGSKILGNELDTIEKHLYNDLSNESGVYTDIINTILNRDNIIFSNAESLIISDVSNESKYKDSLDLSLLRNEMKMKNNFFRKIGKKVLDFFYNLILKVILFVKKMQILIEKAFMKGRKKWLNAQISKKYDPDNNKTTNSNYFIRHYNTLIGENKLKLKSFIYRSTNKSKEIFLKIDEIFLGIDHIIIKLIRGLKEISSVMGNLKGQISMLTPSNAYKQLRMIDKKISNLFVINTNSENLKTEKSIVNLLDNVLNVKIFKIKSNKFSDNVFIYMKNILNKFKSQKNKNYNDLSRVLPRAFTTKYTKTYLKEVISGSFDDNDFKVQLRSISEIFHNHNEMQIIDTSSNVEDIKNGIRVKNNVIKHLKTSLKNIKPIKQKMLLDFNKNHHELVNKIEEISKNKFDTSRIKIYRALTKRIFREFERGIVLSIRIIYSIIDTANNIDILLTSLIQEYLKKANVAFRAIKLTIKVAKKNDLRG